jgi:TnpA family transposase
LLPNANLVSAQNQISLAHAWGGGEVASADGIRFVVPIRTVHAGPNPKYFGVGSGVTYYDLTSNQFTGLNGIAVPGTLRDSLVLLAVLLEQQRRRHETEFKARRVPLLPRESAKKTLNVGARSLPERHALFRGGLTLGVL